MTHFSSALHPLSPVIFATATALAFVLLRNSRFNSHCYTQREATPTQKLARKWICDLPQLLAWKITKGIHLCKPASLNRPIAVTISCSKIVKMLQSLKTSLKLVEDYAMIATDLRLSRAAIMLDKITQKHWQKEIVGAWSPVNHIQIYQG